MITLLALVFVVLVFLLKTGFPAKGPLLAILGSGGHTGELLCVLEKLRKEPIVFVYGKGDNLSVKKAEQIKWPANFVALPRARNVHQSFITSIYSSLKTALYSLKVLLKYKPRIIICNGPGTCLVVVLVCRILLLNSKVVYIESFARVQSLSLTGKLMYHLRLANRFLVQWPELENKFPNSEFIGPLI